MEQLLLLLHLHLAALSTQCCLGAAPPGPRGPLRSAARTRARRAAAMVVGLAQRQEYDSAGDYDSADEYESANGMEMKEPMDDLEYRAWQVHQAYAKQLQELARGRQEALGAHFSG